MKRLNVNHTLHGTHTSQHKGDVLSCNNSQTFLPEIWWSELDQFTTIDDSLSHKGTYRTKAQPFHDNLSYAGISKTPVCGNVAAAPKPIFCPFFSAPRTCTLQDGILESATKPPARPINCAAILLPTNACAKKQSDWNNFQSQLRTSTDTFGANTFMRLSINISI